MRKLGITNRVMKLLEDNLVKVILYDRIFSNPTVEVVDEGAKLAAKRILFSPSCRSSLLRYLLPVSHSSFYSSIRFSHLFPLF